MDGNRTHPGRLNSAPQTVLKTAGMSSASVHTGPLQFDRAPSDSGIVRLYPSMSAKLAVFLAVSDPFGGGLLIPRFRFDSLHEHHRVVDGLSHKTTWLATIPERLRRWASQWLPEFRFWSRARDLNLGPHDPELHRNPSSRHVIKGFQLERSSLPMAIGQKPAFSSWFTPSVVEPQRGGCVSLSGESALHPPAQGEYC